MSIAVPAQESETITKPIRLAASPVFGGSTTILSGTVTYAVKGAISTVATIVPGETISIKKESLR